MAELNGFQRNAAMARAMSGAKTMPVGMGNLTAQWGGESPEVQLRAPSPQVLERGVPARSAPGRMFPDRQPWNAPTMSQVYDGLSQSPEFDPNFRRPTPIPRNVPRYAAPAAPNGAGIMRRFPIPELDQGGPGTAAQKLLKMQGPDPAEIMRGLGEIEQRRIPREVGSFVTTGQDMARRMGGYMGSQTSASKASRMADIMGAAAAVKDLFNSDAINASGAMDAAAPVARASVPYARAALGAASRFVWPAYVAAAGYGLGKDAMDPNSALRQASAPAKADMRRDWAEGNYLSAVGDVVRATAATAPEVISQLLTPKPIFGGDNQRGLLQGLFGAERPEERNARLAQEASPEGRYQAYLAAGGPANIDEFRQQRGSKATPAQGAQAQSAAVPRDMAIPFSVWDDYAKVYHAMAPKPLSQTDMIRQYLTQDIMAQAKQDQATLTDPKQQAAARDRMRENLMKVGAMRDLWAPGPQGYIPESD